MSDQQKASRRKRANEVRLNAIRQKVERNAVEKSQIKSSLLALDEKKKSTHITFSDSDDTDNDNISTYDDEPKTKKKNFDEVLGFDDDDSSENEIEIKPQFEGKHGEKLLELQSGYGNDKRFKLDKRFAEEEENSDNDEGIDIDYSVKTKETEMQKNLKLLNEVIGHDVTVGDKSKKKSEKFIDVSSRRYDPSKSEHLEVKPEKKKVVPTKKKKKKKVEPEPATVTEVDSKKFYAASTNVLRDAFAAKSEQENVSSNEKQESEPFSFLAMLGRNTDNEDVAKDTNNDKTYQAMDIEDSRFKMSSVMKKDIPTLNNKFRYDSSDTEDEYDSNDNEDEVENAHENVIKHENYKGAAVSKIPPGESKPNSEHPTTFFMKSPSDPRIIEGIKLFCWNKSFEQVRNEYLEVKDTLIKDYKKKHRDAKRKEKKAKFESKLIGSNTTET